MREWAFLLLYMRVFSTKKLACQKQDFDATKIGENSGCTLPPLEKKSMTAGAVINDRKMRSDGGLVVIIGGMLDYA